MNWMQQFQKRAEREKLVSEAVKTTETGDISEPVKITSQEQRRVSVPKAQTGPVSIKDLSRDELIACIRDLESELGEPEAVIDEYWGIVDLQVWLRGLEQQAKGGRYTVNLSPEELEYYRVKPDELRKR